MSFPKSILFLSLIVILLVGLSACVPDLGGSSPDPEGDQGDVADQDQPPPDPASASLEGNAALYYQYSVETDILVFDLKPVIGLTMVKNADGLTYDVDGIGEIPVHFYMEASGGESGRCSVICDVEVKFLATGGIYRDDNNRCEMRVDITLVPDQDNWEIGGDCPPEGLAVMDCAALTLLMADPGPYVFAGNGFETLSLPSGNGATRKAELKQLQLPNGLESYCKWSD